MTNDPIKHISALEISLDELQRLLETVERHNRFVVWEAENQPRFHSHEYQAALDRDFLLTLLKRAGHLPGTPLKRRPV